MLSQLLERELNECLRLVVAIPMDMTSFYGNTIFSIIYLYGHGTVLFDRQLAIFTPGNSPSIVHWAPTETRTHPPTNAHNRTQPHTTAHNRTQPHTERTVCAVVCDLYAIVCIAEGCSFQICIFEKPEKYKLTQ